LITLIANALFVAAVIMLALVFFLARALRFLVPYRYLLIHHYAASISLFAAVLFLNLTAAAFAVGRRFFLKDTGRKLAHFDRELNAGRTPMPAHLAQKELD
jgi:hypothetical protein